MYGNTAGWADAFSNSASLPFHQTGNAIPEFEGKAAENFGAHIANYTSVEKLLHDITLHYAKIGIADQIYTQMRSIKQGPNKPVGECGLRVEKLFNRFMTIVESASDLSNSDRFLKDLSAAITTAIEFEGKQNSQDTGNAPLLTKLAAQVRIATAEEVVVSGEQKNASAGSNNNKNAKNAKGENKNGNGNNNGNDNGNKSNQKKDKNWNNKNRRDSSAESRKRDSDRDNKNNSDRQPPILSVNCPQLRKRTGKFFADSGADISVVKVGELAPCYPYDTPKNIKVQDVTHGTAVHVVSSNFPIENSGIIGWDLIHAHKGCVDADNKCPQLGDIKLPFEFAELVKIPARVKMVIGARVRNDDVNVKWVPLQNLHPNLLFSKFTDENINGRVYAECINISDTEVTIDTPTVELEEVETAITNSPPADEDGGADSDANSSAKIRRVINSDKHVEKY
ncbi:hypothetical protein TSAR_000206 [Trichomalopsis sarcophagae]|uniref:Peptidase A2 domain-containing protein n=1 Tax=Trichomalopsis sarcophagae TaxID=543379 RepID=A0A232FDZ3_9HYME|nr:hypothetical protein TSAR_000206 [Trichomalopsis sarcophagae]